MDMSHIQPLPDKKPGRQTNDLLLVRRHGLSRLTVSRVAVDGLQKHSGRTIDLHADDGQAN